MRREKLHLYNRRSPLTWPKLYPNLSPFLVIAVQGDRPGFLSFVPGLLPLLNLTQAGKKVPDSQIKLTQETVPTEAPVPTKNLNLHTLYQGLD